MKTLYILSFLAVVGLCSCSSAYKTGQTPDDVYYSPSNQRNAASNNNNYDNGEYYNANPNDQYLMMRVQDPNRWSAFDDYDYGYAGSYYPYGLGYGYGPASYGFYGGYSPWLTIGYWNPYYSYMSGYYAWNSFYNPYYGGVVVVNPKYGAYNTYTQLHPFNISSYSNTAFNNRNGSNMRTVRFYNPNMSSNRNSPNAMRRFNNQNMNNNSNNFRPAGGFQPSRSFSPSSSGGGARSFGRPGKG